VNPFPDDHELISLFSQEPELRDADVPWFYNTLTFRGQSESASYLVRISPAYGELEIHITHLDATSVSLSLAQVRGLTLHESPTEALIMATFAADTPCGLLKLRLRPHLQIEWPFEKH
jgi:hypothetical protein